MHRVDQNINFLQKTEYFSFVVILKCIRISEVLNEKVKCERTFKALLMF